MLKKLNKKGFTLAELLIVVAIIGVLVAISIPIFTAQLRKARLATNQANARAAYAASVAKMLDDKNTATTFTYTVSDATLATSGTATTGNKDIQSWGVDTEVKSGKKLGDEVAKSWIISFTKSATTNEYELSGIDAGY